MNGGQHFVNFGAGGVAEKQHVATRLLEFIERFAEGREGRHAVTRSLHGVDQDWPGWQGPIRR